MVFFAFSLERVLFFLYFCPLACLNYRSFLYIKWGFMPPFKLIIFHTRFITLKLFTFCHGSWFFGKLNCPMEGCKRYSVSSRNERFYALFWKSCSLFEKYMKKGVNDSFSYDLSRPCAQNRRDQFVRRRIQNSNLNAVNDDMWWCFCWSANSHKNWIVFNQKWRIIWIAKVTAIGRKLVIKIFPRLITFPLFVSSALFSRIVIGLG